MADQPDAWIAAAKKGDRTALAKLLTLCDPKLRAHAAAHMDAAMRSRVALDDLLQEVYVQVFRQIGQFRSTGLGPLVAWVQAILDHRLADMRRAARCRARDVSPDRASPGVRDSSSYVNLLNELRGTSDTPSGVIRKGEALEALAACLQELSEPHRQVIELRFVEGLPVKVTSARLGKTEAATIALTQRALRALRRSMEARGEFTRMD